MGQKMEQLRFHRALRHMNLRAVSRETGVHSNTLYAFMAGKSKLCAKTMDKLRIYLEARGFNLNG